MPDPGAVAIGIDIGGTNIRAARVAADGRIDGLVRTRTIPDRVPETIIDLVRGHAGDRVTAVGIGIPGRLDRDGTTVVSAGYVRLAGVRLGELVTAATGLPAVLDNDAHMALVAELAIGAAAGARDVVLFTVGTGIGGAVALGGRVIRGAGNAGQLGHLTVEPEGAPCNCGRRGCSEVVASGTALGLLIRDAGLPADTTAEALLARADGDPVATSILRRWAIAWRHAIDTAVAAVDPELVLLGGGLGSAAAAAVTRFAPPGSAWFDRPIAPARLGDDAGVIGAGLRALGA